MLYRSASILIFSLFILACSTSQETIKLDIDKPEVDYKSVEKPPEPKGTNKPMPPKKTKEDKEAMKELELKKPGVFLDNQKAAYFGELKIYNEELYFAHQYNLKSFKLWQDSFWESYKNSLKKLKRVQKKRNSWWYRNKSEIAWSMGFLFGSALTVGVTHAVND